MDEHAVRVDLRRQGDPNGDGREDALLGVLLRGRDVEQARSRGLGERRAREQERDDGGGDASHGVPPGAGAGAGAGAAVTLRLRMRNTTRRFFARPASVALSAIGCSLP